MTELYQEVHVFDQERINQVYFDNSYDHQYAKDYLVPLIRDGVKEYVSNVETQMMLLAIDDLRLPITVNQAEYDNCYVVSPYGHYILYAIEELWELGMPVVEWLLKYLLLVLGWMLQQTRLNKVVIVNNWLLSTNLYPEISEEQVQKITEYLQKRFPDHAILFRSVNQYAYPKLYQHLSNQNYRLVLSRQVYLYDVQEEERLECKARQNLRRDLQLIQKKGYQMIEHEELTEAEIPRIVQLYNALYIDKYSTLNPQFTEKFLKLGLKHKLFLMKAIKKDGQIDAVLGDILRNGVMTTPLLGYDTSLTQDTGLYRMVFAQVVENARGNGFLLNESSGASSFKRRRGGQPAIEYTAVYLKHLPFYRKIPWRLLQGMLNKLGIYLLQKYKL